MREPENKQTLEEAVRLFLQLEESPDNPSFQAQRDAFVSRGEAEKAAYEKTVAGWHATGIKPRNNTLGVVVLAAGLLAAGFFAAEPLRIAVVADVATGRETSQSDLTSGDVAYLDAGSAIIDDTGPDQDFRSVEVLKGAVFFEVAADDRPFHVTLGDVKVEVVGTAFETAMLDDVLAVEVAKGIVRVSIGVDSWRLEAGDRLVWSGDRATLVSDVPLEAVAGWRKDQLIVENMPVAQVVDILDRRIAGGVMIVGDSTSEKTVSGSFDLTDPVGALNILAATQNATVVSGRPLGTLLILKN